MAQVEKFQVVEKGVDLYEYIFPGCDVTRHQIGQVETLDPLEWDKE